MAGEATARTQVPPPCRPGLGGRCGAAVRGRPGAQVPEVPGAPRWRTPPWASRPAWPTTEELTPLPLSVSWMRNKLKDI